MKISVKGIVTIISLLTTALGILGFYSFKYEPVMIVARGMNDTEKDSLTLVSAGVKVFPLDSVTAPYSIGYYQCYYDPAAKGYLTFINKEALAIYYYDLETATLERKVALQNYGYSRADKIQGYLIINNDSVLIYNYLNSEIALVNMAGEKLLRRTLCNGDEIPQKRVYPFVTTGAPVAYDRRHSKVFLTGYVAHEFGVFETDKRRNVLTSFDLQTGEIRYLMNYPDFYWGKNWGGAGGFRQVFFAYNPDKSNLVLSFMASHELIVWEPLTDSCRSFFAGSRSINEIRSMEYDPMYFELQDKYKTFEYYCTSPAYLDVIYDSYRKVYYRVAELPLENFNASDLTANYKPKVIMIFNEDLEKVGEINLAGAQYDTRSHFVSEEGLHIRIIDRLDDDVLKFQLFTMNVNNRLNDESI